MVMRKPFKHKLIFPNKSTYLSYSHKKHVHIQIKIQPLHLANEKHLQQYDNMMSNYQLKFKEIVQNNQTTTGSNKTLGGGEGWRWWWCHFYVRRFLFTLILTAFRLENSGTHLVITVQLTHVKNMMTSLFKSFYRKAVLSLTLMTVIQ